MTGSLTLTYAGFLAIFLGLPLLALAWLTRRDYELGRSLPGAWGGARPWAVLAAHMALAVAYTTPWDNYLVASRVWYYDPARVLGVTLGWVPIEEYTFFVLQTLLTGLWVLWLARRAAVQPEYDKKQDRSAGQSGARRRSESRREAGNGADARHTMDAENAPAALSLQPDEPGLWPLPPLRLWAAAAAGVAWLAAVGLLVSGRAPATYLALTLAWMLPPVALQLAVGADTLWRWRRQVALGLLAPVLYLSAADALAIGAGVWTINPAQSTGLLLGGVLPVEEFIFFTITNVLIVFGMTLMLVRGRELKEAVRVAQVGTR